MGNESGKLGGVGCFIDLLTRVHFFPYLDQCVWYCSVDRDDHTAVSDLRGTGLDSQSFDFVWLLAIES